MRLYDEAMLPCRDWGVIVLEAVSITAESLAQKNQIVVFERTIPELRNFY
ncbi:MAG: hypothetical protein ACTSU5_10420 [Promethearchaeota archaeon]